MRVNFSNFKWKSIKYFPQKHLYSRTSITTSTTTLCLATDGIWTLPHSPSELEDGLGGGGDVAVWPGQEVELGDRPRLARLVVLQVEGAHQVVIAPHVLRHQVHLRKYFYMIRIYFWISWKCISYSFLRKRINLYY